MRDFLRAWWLLPLSLLLLGAAPELTPEELVRQGNDAFEREDFDAAVKLYTQAEERITNPGLVAYNKATALYRLSDFRGAEVHYRRALEDATAARRAAMLYDLGNSLLQQSQGNNVEQLKDAMKCYLLCLRETGSADGLRDDARHNLELAKLLWLKAKHARPNKDPGSNDDEKKDPPPEQKKPPDDVKQPGTGDPNPGNDPKPTPTPTPDPSNPNQTPTPTNERPPGTGDLPPIPEKAERTPMLPEDAAAHVQRAAERILREKRDHQQKLAPPASKVIPDY